MNHLTPKQAEKQYLLEALEALADTDDDQECGCVLPEQSCPVCRAKARNTYTEWEIE